MSSSAVFLAFFLAFAAVSAICTSIHREAKDIRKLIDGHLEAMTKALDDIQKAINSQKISE